MINKPFIHLLKSPYHHYLFDVNTNSIVRISEELFRYLNMQKEDSPASSCALPEELSAEWETLVKNGYLKQKRPEQIDNPDIDDIDYLFSHHLRQLVLQVTQQCNFRCSYCPYTLGDDYLQRGHSAKRMDWDTAKRAIDFFAERSRDVPNPAIGFYGGEPLLEADLIVKAVKYCKHRFAGKTSLIL